MLNLSPLAALQLLARVEQIVVLTNADHVVAGTGNRRCIRWSKNKQLLLAILCSHGRLKKQIAIFSLFELHFFGKIGRTFFSLLAQIFYHVSSFVVHYYRCDVLLSVKTFR